MRTFEKRDGITRERPNNKIESLLSKTGLTSV